MPAETLASIIHNRYLPGHDVLLYALMVVADIVIVRFWWFVMSRLGDR